MLGTFRPSKNRQMRYLKVCEAGSFQIVIRVAENGAEYEEPPYTKAEKQEFRRRNQGVVAVMHGSRTIVPQPPRPPKGSSDNR